MDGNQLKMNDGKTEFIMFGSKYQLNKCVTHHININGLSVQKADVIRYLGAWMDKHLSFKHHIKVKCKVAMFNLIRIKRLRAYLMESMCNILVLSLVMSHIDYANSILMKLPDCVLGQTQRVQDMAAKIVMGKSKYDSHTQCCKALHWLPIKAHIKHKLLTLVHKCVHGEAPQYLEDLICEHKSKRDSLRSANEYRKLLVPSTRRSTFADRAFSVNGLKKWNALPEGLRKIAEHKAFKAHLKTYLFRREYN